MTLLKEIKKIVYTSGSNKLHMKHNMAMVHISFMDLQQEIYQDIQDFRDQYMSVRKVCDELELTFGRCKSDTRALLNKENRGAIGGCTESCRRRTSHDNFPVQV